jgi:hypothetical protein
MTLSELVAALRAAKSAETAAKNERLRIEGLITDQFAKPESNEGTHNDEEFKINWKLTRTVDTQAVQNAWEHLGPNSQKAFRWKAEVDLAQLRALQSLDPEAYKQVAEYITTKPAKPSIELKD